jgi:hypothetical protein
LKICALPHLLDEEDEELQDMSIEYYSGDGESQKIQKLQVLFENENHHNGSLYCVDWSRS